MLDDNYRTIEGEYESLSKDKGSKFLGYAYHVENEDEIRAILIGLRKKYYNATHHCYAWRLGAKGERFRSNDDGEPSGTAGKPILGQLLSNELTYILIVVVRYFGGTKLGVSGLISAYKQAAAEVIESSNILTLTEDAYYEVLFDYLVMNDVMKIIKDDVPKIIEQKFDNRCRMVLAIRRSQQDSFATRLIDVEGLELNFIQYK